MDSRPPWRQQGERFDFDDDDEHGPPAEATMSFPQRFTQRLPRPSPTDEGQETARRPTATAAEETGGGREESAATATATGQDGDESGNEDEGIRDGKATTYTTPLRCVRICPKSWTAPGRRDGVLDEQSESLQFVRLTRGQVVTVDDRVEHRVSNRRIHDTHSSIGRERAFEPRHRLKSGGALHTTDGSLFQFSRSVPTVSL